MIPSPPADISIKGSNLMRSFITFITGLAIAATLSACQKSGATAVTDEDMSLGNPNAKVTVIEYASVACPHCADWNMTVFQAFKTKYIDTGKVHYIAREALVHDPSLAAAGFLTARCAGKDKYFQVVDAIYRGQAEMEATPNPRPLLLNIAKSAGLTEAQFNACINDEKALAAINARWQKYIDEDKINSTPTFVINGTVYDSGEMPLTALDAAIAQAEGAAKAGS